MKFGILFTPYFNPFHAVLRNDCSSGFDRIPVKFIKSASDHIISPLVHIINSSIDHEQFPDKWKIGRICPVPKIDNPSKPKDYRPISILPVLSKVYEKVILGQLINHINAQNIYNNTQSGFRKGHSTTTLLLKFRDDIQKAMNKHEITLSVLIDYSKAFDTINHELLLKKLVELKQQHNKDFDELLDKSSSIRTIEDKSSKKLTV